MHRSCRQGIIWVVLLSLALAGCTGGAPAEKGTAFTWEGVADKGVYREPVTPRAVLADGASLKQLTLNGAPFANGTRIAESGEYKLAILVESKQGKVAADELNFKVKIPEPSLEVAGVAPGETYNKPVTPKIILGEGTILKELILNGNPFQSGTTIVESEEYTLKVSVENSAGERAHQSVSFKVEINGPYVFVSGVEDGESYDTGVHPLIGTLSFADTVSAKLNGAEYALEPTPDSAYNYLKGAYIADAGEYELEVTATDRHGISSAVTIRFSIQEPVIDLPDPPAGLSAVLRNNYVQLSWYKNEGMRGYKVYRGTSPDGTDRECLTEELITEGSYRDLDVQEGQIYWYWVQAYDPYEKASPLGDPVSSPEIVFTSGVIRVPEQFGSIQRAIDAAWDGDTIVVSPGTYRENLDFLGKNIILTGTDPHDPAAVAATVIDGGGQDAVITIINGTAVAVRGFTITGGAGKEIGGKRLGGGIYVERAEVEISHNVITGNSADEGGGVYIKGDLSVLEKNVVTANSAVSSEDDSGGGGLYLEGDRHIIEENTISHNTSAFWTGGLHLWGNGHTVERNVITDNTSPSSAAGLTASGKGFVIIGNTISNNASSGKVEDLTVASVAAGGGLFVSGDGNKIEDNAVNGNSGMPMLVLGDNNLVAENKVVGNAGRVEVIGLTNVVVKNEIRDNHSAVRNIGLRVEGDNSSIEFNEVLDNTSGAGTAFLTVVGDNITIRENIIGGNRTTSPYSITAAGMNVYGTNVTIEENEIYDNVAEITTNGGSSIGGGLFVTGEGNTIVGNKIRGNEVTGSGNGGGMYVSGQNFIIQENELTGNTATVYGGGIFVAGYDHTIEDNVITDNIAVYGGGGGLYLVGDGHTVNRNEIRSNASLLTSRGGGGGLYIMTGSHTVTGNQITGNTSATVGGGLYVRGFFDIPATVVLTGNTIEGNQANEGGGLFVSSYSKVVDGQRKELTAPDTQNTWSGNTPDGFYKEP